MRLPVAQHPAAAVEVQRRGEYALRGPIDEDFHSSEVPLFDGDIRQRNGHDGLRRDDALPCVREGQFLQSRSGDRVEKGARARLQRRKSVHVLGRLQSVDQRLVLEAHRRHRIQPGSIARPDDAERNSDKQQDARPPPRGLGECLIST